MREILQTTKSHGSFIRTYPSMTNNSDKKYLCFPARLSVTLFYIILLFGCGSKYLSINQVDNINELPINRIAIVPIAADHTASYETVEGATVLTRLLLKKLDRFYYLIPEEKVEALLSKTHSLRAQQIAILLGRELEVDAVLMGLVNYYQSRKGNDYSVSQPASVAFELHLTDGKRGTLLWSANFDKTQKSLSEDLSNFSSFLQGEWRWLTAEGLMELGVNQIIDKFPGIRKRQEQRKLKPLRSPSLDMG